MTLGELGAIGEFFGSILTLVTLVYLATQIRQNTAQQKREELLSIQHGQNQVLSQMMDPKTIGAWVRGSADPDASAEDRAVAVMWVIQYLNHFQVVDDLHRNGAIDEESYQLWAGYAVGMLVPEAMRRWWTEEDGRLGFHSDVRELIDRRLADRDDPPVSVLEMWSAWNPEEWKRIAERDRVAS